MAKIRISTKQNSFTFLFAEDNREKNKNINLTQTNIINTDSMIFTTNYIYKNIDIVSSFIYSISVQRNINKIIINDYELTSLALLITKDLKNITEIIIKPDEELTYEVYERLLFSTNINKINCYSMKPFMLEQLDKNNKDITTRREILFVSDFMLNNKLDNYASIYYKKNIVINNKLIDKDIEDLEIFCKVNKHLKSIDINYFSRENVRTIINVLARNKIKNIKININQNESNIEEILASINYLRIIQNRVKKDYNYKLTIIYSEEYRKKNMLSQLTINNIKVCCVIIIIIVVLGLLVIEYNNIRAVKNINKINDFISNEITKIYDNSTIVLDVPSSTIIYDEYSSSIVIDEVSSQNIEAQLYTDIFSKLKEENEETVGYLKVNNTKVDYPVVKTINNKYYLTHDFYKKVNTFGWVYMDFRNNELDLNENTIIYGHNTRRGIMFASLVNSFKEEWYTNEENLTITFNTPYYLMEWQIFSMYKVDVTNDYLDTTFESLDDYQNFINLVTDRSIHDFNIEVNTQDKVLTLSTCVDGTKRRAVIHAKLISQTKI